MLNEIKYIQIPIRLMYQWRLSNHTYQCRGLMRMSWLYAAQGINDRTGRLGKWRNIQRYVNLFEGAVNRDCTIPFVLNSFYRLYGQAWRIEPFELSRVEMTEFQDWILVNIHNGSIKGSEFRLFDREYAIAFFSDWLLTGKKDIEHSTRIRIW